MAAVILGDVPYGKVAYASLNPSLAARGLIAETGNPGNSIGGIAMTDGVIHFIGINLFAGMRITGAGVVIATAGATVTLSKAGLYTKAGALLGATADQGTSWQTAGSYTIPFTAAVNVSTTDMYYAAIIAKGGTVPAPLRTGQSMVAAGAINSGSLPFGIQAAQTDLISSATIVAGSGSPPVPWIGLY
jgi:hypothetical protein